MPQFKSFNKNQQSNQLKHKNQRMPQSQSHNQQNIHVDFQFPPDNQNAKQTSHSFLPIKDYKLRLKQNDSFLGGKILKRKNSILSNIYRPKLQSTEQSTVKNYIEIKNMNLIKENIKKIEIKIGHGVPSLSNDSSRHKFRISNSLKHECKTERTFRQPSHRDSILILPDELKQQMFSKKRKLSQHFDRSKYFKCEPFLNKQQKYMSFQRQKTEYRINVNLAKQKMIKEKIKQNLIEEVVPILKQRTNKPKTAGGFLKKYRVQQVCRRPDFELHLTEDDLF